MSISQVANVGRRAPLNKRLRRKVATMQKEVGDYLLTQRLGYGSMGETYLSEHRHLKRPFIVKLLPSELSSDAEFISRFETTVPLLATLEHPHIAKIHNATCFKGKWVLISEPVADSFSAFDLSLSEEEVARVAHQIASALDYAHGKGMAHGAIKLSNVLIRSSSEGPLAHLTDCGLASLLCPAATLSRIYYYLAALLAGQEGFDAYPTGSTDLIKASALQRSFCERFFFLAPEQKIANHPKKDPIKSDEYAFGVLIYYLLTKEFPEGRFPLPSERKEGLKWDWDEWLSLVLHPDPEQRPAALLPALEELVLNRRAVTRLKELKRSADRLAPTSGPRPLLKPQEIARPNYEADPAAALQVDTTVATYRPLPQEITAVEPLLTEMVVVPAGNYMRGSNHGGRDEMPRHTIFLDSFAIDIHPVTNEQFVLFLEVMGGEKDKNNNDIIRLKDSRIRRCNGKLTIESGYSKHPVVGVTWYGAVAYAKWVGKRLPTEAEWEIAACGGKEDLSYPTGNQIERSDANFFSSDTTAVLSCSPNAIGLFDMAGNVYEWCQDWYDYHFYDLSMQEPNNPTGPSQGIYRVLRGGCWKSSKEDLRCAHRHRNNPGSINGTYGFRCAADVASTP